MLRSGPAAICSNAPTRHLQCEESGNNITDVDTAGIQVVKAALEPLCGELHEIFSASVSTANSIRRANGLTESVYNSLGADLTRALVHSRIEDRGGIDTWQLAGNHNLRGQLLLRSRMMRVRFLHEASGAIPPAGGNVARRAYYRNPPFGQTRAFDAESSNLLAIWQIDDPELLSIRFRIVRPISDTSRWRREEVDLDLDFNLPDTTMDLSRLEFEQVDEELMLELPYEAKEDGDDEAGSAVDASDVG